MSGPTCALAGIACSMMAEGAARQYPHFPTGPVALHDACARNLADQEASTDPEGRTADAILIAWMQP